MSAPFTLDYFDTQILTRLHTLAGVQVFDLLVGSGADAPKLAADGSQRVRPYLVYQAPGGGDPFQHPVACQSGDLVLRPFVKCVAGLRHEVSDLVTQVRDLLIGWTPNPPTASVGVSPLSAPLGFEPGPVLVDRGESPPRPWLALWFEFTVST